MYSCSGNKQADNTGTDETEQKDTVQKYAYQRAFTTLEWTAYKTTARIGVKGTFTEFEVSPGKEEGTPVELMDQLSFKIPVSTTSSNDSARDGKLVNTFFGSMMNTENITGKFTRIDGDDKGGKVYILINMNDTDHEVEAGYTIADSKVEIKATLQLADWKAESSVKALNDVCKDLHTGEDGVSKLWPDVDLVITSSLKPL